MECNHDRQSYCHRSAGSQRQLSKSGFEWQLSFQESNPKKSSGNRNTRINHHHFTTPSSCRALTRHPVTIPFITPCLYTASSHHPFVMPCLYTASSHHPFHHAAPSHGTQSQPACHAVPLHGIQSPSPLSCRALTRHPATCCSTTLSPEYIQRGVHLDSRFHGNGIAEVNKCKLPLRKFSPVIGGGKRFCRASGQAAGTYKIVRRRASTGR